MSGPDQIRLQKPSVKPASSKNQTCFGNQSGEHFCRVSCRDNTVAVIDTGRHGRYRGPIVPVSYFLPGYRSVLDDVWGR